MYRDPPFIQIDHGTTHRRWYDNAVFPFVLFAVIFVPAMIRCRWVRRMFGGQWGLFPKRDGSLRWRMYYSEYGDELGNTRPHVREEYV